MPGTRCSHVTVVALAAMTLSGWAVAADLELQVHNSAGEPIDDAVVYLMPTAPLAHAAAAKATIDQINRQFVPRVSVIQAGTAVAFPNSDNIRHSVYSFSKSKTFTLKLYAGTPSSPVVFDSAGVVVLGCNIHDRMVAWVLVLDTPYFARTDRSGVVKLSSLPPGDYRLRAWHEPMSAEQPGEMIHVDAQSAALRQLVLDASAADMSEMGH
jgi:plastocyanin